jgi:hypothetical protein
MRRRTVHTRTITATIAALMLLAPPAVAGRRDKPIAVLGAAGALTVRLETNDRSERVGRATLLVRNTSSGRLRLRVRYIRTAPGGASTALVIVTSPSARRATWAMTPTGVVGAVATNDTASVHLRLVANATPSGRATGRLLITAERWPHGDRSKRRILGPPAVVPVMAVPAEQDAVTVHPKRVSIPVERVVGEVHAGPSISFHEDREDTSVLVRGVAVGSLGPPWPEGVVRRKDGRTLTVEVAKAKPAGEDQRQLVLRAAPGGRPGKYTGDMVFGAGENPVGLVLTVNVRTWFWVAVLLVFLGALLGQFVPRLLGVRRSRQWLRARLRRAIKRYAWYRRRRKDSVSYDLPDVVGRWRGSRRKPSSTRPTTRRAACFVRSPRPATATSSRRLRWRSTRSLRRSGAGRWSSARRAAWPTSSTNPCRS